MLKAHKWYLFGILLIFILQATVNLIWLAVNDRPPMWDSALHLTNALEYVKYLQSGHFSLEEFLSISHYYPPLFYLNLIPILLVRTGPDSATLVHLPFLLALLASVYYLGYKLLNSRPAGLLAAFLVGTFPHIQWLSRDVMIDLETVSLSAVLVALAVASNGFCNRRLTLVLGIVFGISLLFKWNILFFVFFPLAWLAVLAFRHAADSPARKKILDSLLLGALAGAAVAWPWYLKNISFLISHFLPYTQGLGPIEGDPGLWTLEGWAFYFRALLSWQLFLPFFLIFLAALIGSVIRKRPGLGLLLAWIAGPYLILSLFANKAPRHITPVLPAVALIIAGFLFSLQSKLLRRILVSACCLVGIFQVWMVSFGVAWLPRSVNAYPLDRPAFEERIVDCADGSPIGEHLHTWPDGWFVYNQDALGIFGPPEQEDWKIPKILSWCQKNTLQTPADITLGLVPDCTRFNVWSFRSTALIMELDTVIWRISVPDDAGRCFDPFDFVLIKCGNQGPAWGTEKNRSLTEFVLSHPERFSKAGEWSLPDGSLCRLYENNKVIHSKEAFNFS